MKDIKEDVPANAMGFSSSTPGTGGIDTFDPLLNFKKRWKKAYKKKITSMIRRKDISKSI